MWIHLLPLNLIDGAGGSPVPPTPTPDVPPGGGKGAKKRRYLITRDGQRREIDDSYALERAMRDILARKDAESVKPKKKAKPNKPVPAKPGTLLQKFASWDTLEAELLLLEQQAIQERVILDMMLAIMAREMIREDDEEFMLILEMMT
jgi:hypothetical protein